MNIGQLREIGATGVRVGPLGCGGAAIGNLFSSVAETQATDAIRAAFRIGVHHFDTAPYYGYGLSESRLGPLFPDQSRLHDSDLRARARERASQLGLELRPAIAACLIGPALATPAELRFIAGGPATVAVQDIEGPLIAAAHAGLSVLGLVALVASSARPGRGADNGASAAIEGAHLYELCSALAPDLGAHPPARDASA